MKKSIKITSILLTLVIFAMTLLSCTNSTNHSSDNQNQVESVLNSGVSGQNETSAETERETVQTIPPIDATEGVDVDLTVLNSTMVYAEVYNIVIEPEKYFEKTIKMKGICSRFHADETDTDYYSCIIQDATACCAQGIEFVLKDDVYSSVGYPEAGDEICVVGIFERYYEGDLSYYRLREAEYA